MKIQLNFDTEKDNLDDIKKVCAILQEVIRRRENKMPISEIDLCNVKYKEENKIQPEKKPVSEQPKNTKTCGGCRFVPYEDLTETMNSIFKGKKRF